MPSPIDNKKKGGGIIFQGIDDEYHREVVGSSSSPSGTNVPPGTRVLAAMNGITPRPSRIHPMINFVTIVLNKNPFIWKSVQATKQKIRDSTNVNRKNLFYHRQGFLRLRNSPQLVFLAQLYLCLNNRHS